MTTQEIEHDMKSVEMTMGPNQAYETMDIRNQAGGDDQSYEPVRVPCQVDEQQ